MTNTIRILTTGSPTLIRESPVSYMQQIITSGVFIMTEPSFWQLYHKPKVKIMTVKLKPNEVVLKAGDTSQVIDKTTIAGKLIVTNQGLYFNTLMDETEKFNLEILFDNILEVIYFSQGLFSAKGLSVVTRDGNTFSFPLRKRDEFGQLINKMY